MHTNCNHNICEKKFNVIFTYLNSWVFCVLLGILLLCTVTSANSVYCECGCCLFDREPLAQYPGFVKMDITVLAPGVPKHR